MTLRNVPNSFTLEQQRLEINELAVDLDTAVDGVQTFSGDKTFSGDVTFSSDLTFQAQTFWGDGDQAVFGDDSDFKIYYDGSVGVETSFIDSDALQIRTESDTSDLYATFLKDGPVELYYDGTKRFGTSSTGATVLGDLEVNDELHSASGTFILKTADQITPGLMVTEAVFGASMYVPYGFSTYPISNFPGGGISELSTTDGITITNGGQIYISNSGGSALWKGRQSGTAGITSEITAPGDATFAGDLDIGGTATFDFNTNFQKGVRMLDNGGHTMLDINGTGADATAFAIYDGSGGGAYKVKIKHDGSAEFSGSVDVGGNVESGAPDITNASTGGVEVFASGQLRIQRDGSAVSTDKRFQMYYGTTETVSFTAGGSANFGGGITSGGDQVLFPGSMNVYQSANGSSTVVYNGGWDTGGGRNITSTIYSDGSATFAGTIDATGFTISGSPLQTEVATTSSVGTVQPDGTTIGIDGNGVISVTGGGDPFTADGFKFGVNEATGPAATLGEFRQISGKPYFYDGSAWQEFILGSTQQVTIPAETAWDKVIVRSTFDSDFNDVKFGDTGTPNSYTTYNSINLSPSTIVGTPAKFGTGVLKNVGNGVVYSHRSEYDFESEFTIECWVYFDAAPASYTQAFQEKHVVFSKSDVNMQGGSWQVYVKKSSGGNHFWYIDIHDTATNTETQYELDSIGATWSSSGYDQQWVHIALVKESDGSLHFYKDGQDGLYTYGGAVSGNDITNTTFNLAIGVPQEGGQVQNDMFIDDLRITTDARYTGNGVYGSQSFTPPTTAHPISGTTTTYTPPATSKAGEIVLGATPTWTGTAGVTVAQQSSGNYRLTFTNPFTNATDYYVFTNHMDYTSATKVFVTTTRSNTHVDFSVYREGDGTLVDTGSIAVQVIAH